MTTSTEAVPVVPAVSIPSVRAACEHGWRTASSHRTSLGTVRYVTCVRCGVHRVDLQSLVAVAPTAVSGEVGAAEPSAP